MKAIKKHRHSKRNKKLEKQGKLLVYSKCDEETRALLNISNKAEWGNYLKFNAVRVISAEEAQAYLDQGAEMVPMRWVETDKDEKRRTKQNPLPLLLKSRLVARGDF